MPTTDDNTRLIYVHRDVYALGLIVVPDHLVETFRSVLDEMRGDQWVPIPYDLALTVQAMVDAAVSRKLPYIGKHKMIELDLIKGELKMTTLGTMSLRKLRDNVAKR